MSKTMAQLPYHYGVKLRVFPSSKQKRLRQVKSPIKIVQQRIQTLE